MMVALTDDVNEVLRKYGLGLNWPKGYSGPKEGHFWDIQKGKYRPNDEYENSLKVGTDNPLVFKRTLKKD